MKKGKKAGLKKLQNNIISITDFKESLSKITPIINIKKSGYQDSLDEQSRIKEHKRKEGKKDLQHNIIINFSNFFSSLIKIIVIVYFFGLLLNIFFGYTFELSKLELIIYTFITISLGVLLDRTFPKKKSQSESP